MSILVTLLFVLLL